MDLIKTVIVVGISVILALVFVYIIFHMACNIF